MAFTSTGSGSMSCHIQLRSTATRIILCPKSLQPITERKVIILWILKLLLYIQISALYFIHVFHMPRKVVRTRCYCIIWIILLCSQSCVRDRHSRKVSYEISIVLLLYNSFSSFCWHASLGTHYCINTAKAGSLSYQYQCKMTKQKITLLGEIYINNIPRLSPYTKEG